MQTCVDQVSSLLPTDMMSAGKKTLSCCLLSRCQRVTLLGGVGSSSYHHLPFSEGNGKGKQ